MSRARNIQLKDSPVSGRRRRRRITIGRSYLAILATFGVLLGLLSTPVGADGTETLGPPSIPIAEGNGTVVGGVGLRNAQPGDIVLDVPLDVTVEQVLVYWEGHAAAPDAGFDDDIELDGTNVVGTLIGGPTRFFQSNHSSTYRADVTDLGLVTPGLNTISVGGLAYDLRNNGAGILVITSDGGPASELTVLDGNDLAFRDFPAPRDETVPQTVTFPAAAVDRVGTIDVFASSVAGQDPPGERPNLILATVGGVVTVFPNVLGSFDGEEWDTVTLSIDIPAGATSLTVQAVSDDPADPDTGNLPASLAWNAAAINIPAVPDPGITIEKATNGNDADGANDADVPVIAPGDPVTWTYVVTNTGDVPFDITDVVVTDDIIGAITTITDQGDGDNTLAPGETWTYEADGIALDLDGPIPPETVIVDGCGTEAKPGNIPTYENIGTVTVPGDSDNDPSHYCNPPGDPDIELEKLTNGNDADGANDADVPVIAPGDPVTWTYVVTNSGDVPFDITDVVVTDDIIGAITTITDQGDGDNTLAPGETWTYEADGIGGAQDLENPTPGTVIVNGCNPDGTTVPGDRATYENIGTVTVPGDDDNDPSHYCNPPGDPGITIEKLVNGNDADGANDADVPVLTPGDSVVFIYVVTNTGAIPFAAADVSVTDDIPGVVPVFDPSSDVGNDGVLSPDEVWLYSASATVDDLEAPNVGTVVVDGCNPDGTTVPGDRATYENIGTVTVPGDTDSDPGHYCNPPDPDIDIEKLTNGNQADGANDADVPVIAPGDAVTWRYIVTNNGNVAFSTDQVVVTDDTIGAITTIIDQGDGDDVLAPGESWVYEATAPNGAQNLLNPTPGTTVVNGCNPDGTTVPGDRATYENIGTVTVPGDSDNDPSHYCNPPADPEIDIEKFTKVLPTSIGGNVCEGPNSDQFGKPIRVTMRYNGEGADATNTSQQDSKHEVSGDPNGASPVDIVASRNAGGSGDIFFSGSVALGQTFVIDGDDGSGDTDFGSATFVTISSGGNVLQQVEFHTSCSAPLVLGDQFGSLVLEGLEGDDGLVVNIPDPDPSDIGEDADTPTGPQANAGDTIQWTYLVTNPGDVALENVVVEDDNGTAGDPSDDFAPGPVLDGTTNVGDDNDDGNLDPGEVWVYQATGTAVLGQYGNEGDVTATPVGGGPEVSDADPSHYIAVFGADICEAFEKPVRLTLRYTGDGPDANSNSQGDKVTVSGDPNDASPVLIEVNGDSIGQVDLGDTFDITGFGSNTNVVIKSLAGQVLQEVDFHTSCSQPLFIGDQFGAIELVDSVDENGQGPSDPNFTGLLVEKVEVKDDEVKVKLRNTGSTDAVISEIEIVFPSSNGLLDKVKAGSEYKPNPKLGSPALIQGSDFSDPDKAVVEADDNLEIKFEFTEKNRDGSIGDYDIIVRFSDGTELRVT